MQVAKNYINEGSLQGIILNDVTFPNPTTALFSVKVKERDREKGEESGNKKGMYIINCVAFDALAVKMKEAVKGQLIFVKYTLSNSKRVGDDGVVQYFNNRIVSNVTLGEVLDGSQKLIPYINDGICQGNFVSIMPIPRAENIYTLTIRVPSKGVNDKEFTHYINFTVYGKIANSIAKYYNPDDSICIKYQVETRLAKTGSVETEYVMTSVI